MNKEYKKKLESNIWKYYLYNFFFLFIIFEPIIFVYFLKELSFTLTQVMITISVFTFLTAVFEIPTGVIGDKLGYKKTLILAAITMMMGSIGYAMSRSFTHILISEFFWALGFSFSSGTQDAFIYDSLKNIKKEKEYNKINGRATAIFWTGLAVSSIIGSILAKIDLGLPVSLAYIPLFIPLLLVITFNEPKREIKKTSNTEHILESFKHVLTHKKLRFLLFYVVMIVLVLESSYKFFQPFMDSIGLNIAFFGFIFSFGYLVSGIGSLLSHKIENYFGEKKILSILYLIPFLVLLFLAFTNSLIALIGILILLIVDGVQKPTMSDYLNKNIDSHNRATVNSISNLTKTLIFSLFLPILGYIGEITTINIVFLINSIIILISYFFVRIWYGGLIK